MTYIVSGGALNSTHSLTHLSSSSYKLIYDLYDLEAWKVIATSSSMSPSIQLQAFNFRAELPVSMDSRFWVIFIKFICIRSLLLLIRLCFL